MSEERSSRRGFLKGLMGLVAFSGASALAARPAEARSHRRGGWGWGGFYGRRGGSHRRYYGGYGGFNPYGGGYGYGPGLYNRGYYGTPYVVPQPVVPVRPYYYQNYSFPPLMKRDAPRSFDVLKMLDA